MRISDWSSDVCSSDLFYDYDAKYTEGLTEHVCPADVPAEVAQRMKDLALQSHRQLGCKGASRSDFRWDDEHGLAGRSVEHTSELQSLMRTSYAVFCLKKKTKQKLRNQYRPMITQTH